MHQILICNSQPDELNLVQSALGDKYTFRSMSSWDNRPVDLAEINAIILDTNFTQAQGFDFLMEVCDKSTIPVLLITPPDEPQSAIEARRIGAYNYCVKTEKLYSVLSMAVQEMIFASNDLHELKRTILAQKTRIVELESQLGSGDSSGKVLSESQQKRVSLLQEIGKRLSSGEINLPTFPDISIKLEQLMQGDAGIEEIAAMLKKDIAVSAKLISVANSPRYGGMRTSTTVEQAISVLGLNTAKQFVDVIANRSLYTIKNPKYKAELENLWQHGLACAQASRLIAEQAKLTNPGEVFFMGLLHDIGKLLLLQIISELQDKNAIDNDVPKDVLDDFISKQHGVFGRKLIEIWKLPQAFALIAQYHEAIDQAPDVSRELLVVHLGNLLAKRAGFGIYMAEKHDAQVASSIKSIGLDMDNVLIMIEKLTTFMEQTGSSFD